MLYFRGKRIVAVIIPGAGHWLCNWAGGWRQISSPCRIYWDSVEIFEANEFLEENEGGN